MRVLIVEGDPLLGEALAVGLRQLGHAVEWVATGSAPIAALDGAEYDAVVLDLGRPGGDGKWLAHRSR